MTNIGNRSLRAILGASLAATVFAPVAIAQTTPVLSSASAIDSPADQYGDLLVAVQTARIFPDGKTFVDAIPRRDPDAIMADYDRARPKTPERLRQFLLENFIVPGVNDGSIKPIRQHIAALWPRLTRQADEGKAKGPAIGLPAPYVVPGGRFREMYYWDSYFTMLGLAADGRDDLVDSMIDNFTSLIERFGHIPNGTRTYYLSRSQPPFYALMLDISKKTDGAVRARRLAALRHEHAYWMKGEGCATPDKACERVVRMADGSVLNRYWDDRDTPRDESFAEDRATAASASSRPAAEVYRDLRAGAESGWDFSSRWLVNPKDLGSIRTTRMVPVDLNALMWAMEKRIESGCRAVADRACVTEFSQRAARRGASVDRYLWAAKDGRYVDWSMDDKRPGTMLSAATLYPLFVGMAKPAQANAVADTTRRYLLAPGGLRTTTLNTGQQWDAPNGWAPLQWVGIEGLRRYRHEPLSRDIAERWIGTVQAAYRETDKLLEKYDVEERRPGGGGEYPLQDGFGWTNGVTSALLQRDPSILQSE